jgi:hypothetical protein
VQTGMPTSEFFDGVALVDRRVVQQDHNLTPQMAEELAQEKDYLLLSNVIVEQQVIEPQPLRLGAERNSRDKGDLVSSIGVLNDRGLPHRSPGLNHVGNEHESGLVGENYVGAQLRGFFLMRGHFLRFQRSIFSGSRSAARFLGFW